MPAKLNIFHHIVKGENQPSNDVMRTGFRMRIPDDVQTDDLGFSSTLKDGDHQLWIVAGTRLVVPSASPDSMLNIS